MSSSASSSCYQIGHEIYLNATAIRGQMKLPEHFKLAVFAGLVVGTLHGSIDIIAKLAVWSFEWFELYQTLLLSILVFTFIFAALGIFFEVITILFKFRLPKKKYHNFYFTASIALLLFFYASTIVNRDILYRFTFWDWQSLVANFLVFLTISLLSLLMLTKGEGIICLPIAFFNKAKVKKFAGNYIFAVSVFIVVSLLMDAYLLNDFTSSGEKLEGYPNIIYISMDSVRADHLPMYGYDVKTSPNLDKFSKNAAVFKNAISPSLWTILVHGGIFTGKYASNFDPDHTNKGIKKEEKTFVEILKENGYNTAGFVSAAWIKSKYGFGQGFNLYKDRMDFLEHKLTYDKFSIKGAIFTFVPNIQEITDIDTVRSSEEINKDAFKWLEKNKDDVFFLFLHYEGPHAPYNPSKEFRERFTDDPRSFEELEAAYEKSTGLKRYGNVSEDVVDALVNLYDAGIAELDYNVNILFEKIVELGLKNNTIIIIAADSGEEFYDHGYFKHSRTLYQEIIHVPLLIYYPGKLKPKIVKEPVSTIDIFPTLFDILEIGIPQEIDGVSLLPLIKNGSYGREFVKSELFGLPGHETKKQIAIIDNEWKLIEAEPETEAMPSGLYNLNTDPKEQKNLYDTFPEKRKLLQGYAYNSTKK